MRLVAFVMGLFALAFAGPAVAGETTPHAWVQLGPGGPEIRALTSRPTVPS
jgi:hypothetical protein